MLKEIKWFIYSLIIILINVILGHFLPPSSITFSPVVICLISIFVLELKISVCLRMFLIGALISLQDIGIKLFAGGRHDYQGLGWIHFMLMIGLAVSILYIVYYFICNEKGGLKDKIFGILILTVIIYLHLKYFSSLGLEV